MRAALFVALAAAVALVVVLTSGGEESEYAGEEAHSEAPENALRENAKEGFEKRATFEVKGEEADGGEAGRGGPNSPAAQAVADRAYPRDYVTDRRARKTLSAFKSVPSTPSRGAFRSSADFKAATAARAGSGRQELGPFSPNVAPEASQFFDPDTQTGPATQESGRVTALAIDPACAPGDCRMAVAAAGGGIWITDDALAANVSWRPSTDSLPTTAFGSLYYDAAHDVLYAGSGEPNGSSDSEAGRGLYRSTNFGNSWSLVPGSVPVTVDRSISAIAVDPANPNRLYIGTALARHGSSSVNGGRRTPPNAPRLGVYTSINGGKTFGLERDLATKTLPDPTPSDTGVDFFAGGISKLLIDPNHPRQVYAAVFGYGVWRGDETAAHPTWRQVFHTMNQNDFTGGEYVGDSGGDETEFDLVSLGGGKTRMYVGDASDDWAIDGDDSTPAPRAWRNDDIAAVPGDADGRLPASDPMGDTFNAANNFVELSSDDPADNGFAVYNYCQNGQCGYDSLVIHPRGASPDTVWYIGSMNYDELKLYDRDGLGVPPRSNGRALVRSTDAGGSPASIDWSDMTAVLNNPNADWDVKSGIHPDLRAAEFANNGKTAFIGGDGGVYRIDVTSTQDQSSSCAQRTWDYDGDGTDDPLQPDDLGFCQRVLSAVPNKVEPINDGLRTIQFQSVSQNPRPGGQLLGGTQDNGTWSFDPSRPSVNRWFESVGGDGGQSGFDRGTAQTRYHNYYDATPEVNFHGDDPKTWLDIYDPLQSTDEARSFYTPFEADPRTPGRLFTGLQHVWRTDDSGGDENDLVANGCLAVDLDPNREESCGDWVEMGGDLTSAAFGPDRTGDYVVATERAPSDTGTLWAATRTGRVFITSNADDTPGSVQFRRLDTEKTPGRFVTGIAVDPYNPNHAWISYTGYNAYTPDTPGHVFEVTYNPTTRSAKFVDRSYQLGDQPVTALVVDGANRTLYAGTDFGVLRLPAGSKQWTVAGTGIPRVAVYGLTLSERGRTLLAATHGRGAYTKNLPPARGPRVRLRHRGPARAGHRTAFTGSIQDLAGIGSAVISFGDGKSSKVNPASDGSFAVRHRYETPGRYTVQLAVKGAEGKRGEATLRLRVRAG